MMDDLFAGDDMRQSRCDVMAEGAVLLRGFALDCDDDLLAAIGDIVAVSRFARW